jgi:hypothetical protein
VGTLHTICLEFVWNLSETTVISWLSPITNGGGRMCSLPPCITPPNLGFPHPETFAAQDEADVSISTRLENVQSSETNFGDDYNLIQLNFDFNIYLG